MAFNIFEMFGKISADNKQANDAIDETTGKAKTSSGIFSKLGNGLKVIGAGAAVAVGVAGTAAVTLSKQVISAYADYEQLVGGVDTLFGEASKKVQQYADEAFRTAGMSANEYMETVTGFSASLLQSLGGDTEKAADVANQAVTDMSDNANKMGSDITSIQNAYQGFAKQNYTMLDNLKLGYGGTQEEMKRLLEDAEKISGIKYDISSFADVTEAIHVMQTEMGITGTTALEATETISGSIAGMSSAWTNLLAGMGNANADVGKLVNDLVEQFGYVVKNITPVLENIVTALPTVINGLLTAIGELLPTLLTAVTDLFSQVLQTLLSLLPEIIPVAVQAIMTIVQTIVDNLPLLIEAAIVLISTLVSGIGEALPTLIPAAVQAIITIVQGLIDNLPMLLNAALQLILGLAQGLIAGIPMLINSLPQLITSLVNFLVNSIPIIIDAGIQLLTALVTALPTIIAQIVAVIPVVVENVVNAIVSAIPQLIDAGVRLLIALVQNMPVIITTITRVMPQIVNAMSTALLGNLDKIINAGVQLLVALVQNLPLIMTTVASAVPQIIGSLVSAFIGNIGLMAETGLSLITGLKDAFTSIDWGSVGMDIIRGISGGISGAASGLWDAAKSVLGGFKDKVTGFFGIKSPSRWGRDAVGRFIPQGIAVGIEEDAYTMQDALTDAANSLSIDTSHLGATIDPNNINVADYNSQQSNAGSEDDEEKNNAKAGDVFNITLQALGELSDIQLMEMARKLVVFIKELKDRDDSPKGGVFNGI